MNEEFTVVTDGEVQGVFLKRNRGDVYLSTNSTSGTVVIGMNRVNPEGKSITARAIVFDRKSGDISL